MISGIKMRHWMKFTGYKSYTDRTRYFLHNTTTHMGLELLLLQATLDAKRS